ncbi:CLUMA_CG020014, isoform A [Clunio marinus]|uniref:CLUMA_CG020014, isoform A n=1 Tax=Clunio marinus TaxID=568069 RepID=A0A1J1J3N0_9DIPT|nr:CLUMA_CG020014, isoform A [Clunio marinus]
MDPIVDGRIIDWQISRHDIRSRGTYLLETGKWSDCTFLVGSENNQQTLACHKIILAMASPVFETMFYGSFNSSSDPILISDVQADAFKALLEYMYTDKININNVDKAFDLCYAAKKYMLPFVVDQCTKFLWSDLCPKNACRAYEFAKLFEEPSLQEKCLQIICTKTMDVIGDPSFEEVELSTIITILDQDALNVDNELALFFAINRFAEKQGLRHDNIENTDQNQNDENDQIDDPEPINLEAGPSNRPDPQPQPAAQQQQRVQDIPTIRDAVKKIRFLTLTPQQFAEGPARTNLLSQSEAFAILMNISTPNSVYPMPDSFTLNKNPRVFNVFADSRSPSPAILSGPSQVQALSVNVPPPAPAPTGDHSCQVMPQLPLPGDSLSFFHSFPQRHISEERRYYCIRTIQQLREIYNRSVLESSFTFSVDRNVSILGITIFTQTRTQPISNENRNLDRYSEIIYAHLLDSHSSRLTYTHSNQRVPYDSDSEIFFDRPMFIQSNKVYKIGVAFNKIGFYQEHSVHPTFRASNITFTFNTGNSIDTTREGLIRGIIYSM